MVALTARQCTQIFGWLPTRNILVWEDVLRLKLTLDRLIAFGLRAGDLVLLQPDPAQWVQHAGATLKHARFMQPWGANPFVHFGADLGDVLAMGLSITEMVRMEISYAQLVANGMNARTEQMFKLDAEEWKMLGKK